MMLCTAATPSLATEDRIDTGPIRSLEELLEQETSGDLGLPGQMTAATSAVVVVTRADIDHLGLRSLDQVLDHIRGLHVIYGRGYTALSGRGAGGRSGLSGRILVLIDGQELTRNLYGEPQIGPDALLDTDLIDRVEYAPGSGAALYGGNALFGIIHVITRRGRDMAGLQVRVRGGRWGDRSGLITWGDRAPKVGEWLTSLSVDRNGGTTTTDVGPAPPGDETQVDRFTTKWRRDGIWLNLSAAIARNKMHFGPVLTHRRQQTLAFQAGAEGGLGMNWRHSLLLAVGKHTDDWRSAAVEISAQTAQKNRWWTLEYRSVYLGLADHTIVTNWRLVHEPRLSIHYWLDGASTFAFNHAGTQLGVSVEDEIALSRDWRLTLGVRQEFRKGIGLQWSPRLGLAWQPMPSWAVKLSTGRSRRFPLPIEYASPQHSGGESIRTDEVIVEYVASRIKLEASLYAFRSGPQASSMIGGTSNADTANPPSDRTGASRIRSWGSEFGAAYQHRGWHFGFSLGWRPTGTNDGIEAPTSMAKLNAYGPLFGSAWSIGGSYRRSILAGTSATSGEQDKAIVRDILNLQVMYKPADCACDIRFGVGNLLNANDPYYSREQPDGASSTRRAATLEFRVTLR